MVIWGLEKYRYYLEEHSYKVEIWSDHQNLIFFRTAQKLTRRQARWTLFMTYFDFVLYYKPEKIIQVEDPLLSRGSECLSDHPRWIFKKNSMEFFVGLQSYLYYCYSGCTLKSHDHLLFPECSMVT